MKRRWLVLSPHLDDAAFSLGPLLAGAMGDDAVVAATAFTASVNNPCGFALACQTDKGLPDDVDYMALRRQEDIEWAASLGVTPRHGPFPEAPHRGYDSAEALFSGIQSADRIGEALAGWVSELVAELEPDLTFLPAGIGHHVDHIWLRRAAGATLPRGRPLVYYLEQPYYQNRGQPSDSGIPSPARDLATYRVAPDSATMSKAANAAECYKTQIPFQFGSAEQMRQQLQQAWTESLFLLLTQQAIRHTPQFPQPASPIYAGS
jgi:LmbE family N-acetylglucosaminyl deacetylase